MSQKSEKAADKSGGVIAIIPARYGSSRFPGKPLAKIRGVCMIVSVCRRVAEAIGNVVVATDDRRIADEVEANGFKAVMTSPDCPNGTARVLEAYLSLQSTAEIIVNVQGDEPLVNPDLITNMVRSLQRDRQTAVATVASRFDKSEGFEALFDPNRVKMTMDRNDRVLYFSRSIIPYVRDFKWQEWIDEAEFFIHCGLYAFRADTLLTLVSLPPSSLEKAENLEQLRWLENGYHIRAVRTDEKSHPVDTPADLEKIIALGSK